jgi:Protein of unknown function (DUF2637)
MTGRWTYRVSATGVLVLAAAAFTLSYDALHQLALDSRVRPALAWLWPVVIDGTIVVALLTVLAANRAAIRAGYPWALAGLFSAASVAFNIAHAPDRPVAQLVFATAPVALVLTTHLLMQQLGWRHRHAGPDQTPAPVAAAAVDADPRPVPTDTAAGMSANASITPGSGPDRAGATPDQPLGIAGRWPDTTGPNVDSQTAMSGPEIGLQARARQIYQAHCAAGRPVSGAVLARQLGTSERHGRRLLAEFRAKDEGSARRNGDGAAQHQQAGPMPR